MADKYYGTNTFLGGKDLERARELGYTGYHAQFRIVCKAKSMAEANRIAASYGLGDKVFHRDYTSETGNALEIELADEYRIIIRLDGRNENTYVSIEDIVE